MKPDVRVTLFGRFPVQFRGETILDQAPSKVQELLAYLLLNRDRAHPREALAELLWDQTESPHSRKYLRQALWQLHAGFLAVGRVRASRLVLQEPGWVELRPDPGVWIDTVVLEEAFDAVRGSGTLGAADARRIIDAVQLYRGDLLEGRCQEWCEYERYRYRQMYLTLLDKLVGYCEAGRQYDVGIAYGTLALRCDRARERTHRSLMTLRYLAGDRTGALRQYERCAAALREELDVPPGCETEELHRRICNGDAQPVTRTAQPAQRGMPLLVVTDGAAGRSDHRAPAKAALSRNGGPRNKTEPLRVP